MKNLSLIYVLFGYFTLFFTIEIRAQVLDEFQVRFLTNDSSAVDFWPCFSPDGKTILFSRTFDLEKWEFFSISLIDGEVDRFSKMKISISETRASWSKTHNIIVFTGVPNVNEASVWLIKADGSDLKQLKIDGLSNLVFYPSWYPDSFHLAVMDAKDQVIKRIDIPNQIATTITDKTKVLTGRPSVSPDGKLIAFAGQENVGLPYNQKINSIWLIDETGQAKFLENELFQGRSPAWSPDGKKLVFDSPTITNNKRTSKIAIIDISNE